MRTAHRIYATLGVLVLGGAGLALPSRRQAVAPGDPTVVPRAVPTIAWVAGTEPRVTKIELTQPDDDDRSVLDTVILEKLSSGWAITSPLKTRASTTKVEALLQNLKDVSLRDFVEPGGAAAYEADELTREKALHVVVWTGATRVSDLYFGKSIPGGELVRMEGADGVFSVGNSGPKSYSGFLYTRNLRSWRETAIFDFKAEDVIAVEITNRNGLLSFARSEATWTALRSPRRKDGSLGAPDKAWAAFDPSTIDDLLRAYQALSADDFGDEKDRVASGVDQAEETGGVIQIQLRGDPAVRALRIGNVAESTTRWSIKDGRWAIEVGGDGTLYALSPWRAGWATAGPSRFEKADAGTPKKHAP